MSKHNNDVYLILYNRQQNNRRLYFIDKYKMSCNPILYTLRLKFIYNKTDNI